MKKSKWKFKFSLILILSSVFLYFIHYLIFNEAHHMFLFMVEDIALMPIEVLIVSLILHKVIENKEKEHILDKLNMLVGVFFSELGAKLLNVFCIADPNIIDIKKLFKDVEIWNDKDFDKKSKEIKEYKWEINIDKINIQEVFDFLVKKREFLIGLLQNPSLLENETFTELLRTVFHLEDELQYRIKDNLTSDDIEHLKKDIERVYPLLVSEWIIYMKYLKNEHPYLFALAIKENPFN